jgi:GNAT superfamily N-acetyltransferase
MTTIARPTSVPQVDRQPGRRPAERGVLRRNGIQETPRPPTRVDGDRPVAVRELGGGEDRVLDAVFAGLSDRSRYLRFHSPVPRLLSGVRRALLDVDGHRHIALVATAGATSIGIARCIDLGSARAELAIEVVDAWQGRGVGTLLLSALHERAVRAGYRELTAEVLAENDGVRALLRKEFPIQRVVRDGAELSLTLPLGDPWAWDAADLLVA